MKKLFALLMAVTLTFQLVTPVFAEDPEQANADTLPQETEVLVDETKGPDETEEPAETEEPGETEKPTEADAPTAATETDKTGAAETVPTEAEPSEESSALIRVTFIRTPADLTLTVYAADTNTEIDPQEDDTYLLAPGEYTYFAELDGYISEENTFTVSEVDEVNREISVELQSADMEDDASFDSSEYSLQLSRIDELYERIKKNGGFFTVNKQPCISGSGHKKCDNCKLINVINSSWFSDEFGPSVTCTKFALNQAGEAWTCMAFACFAGWFVNRGDDNDSVETASRVPGSFSYDFLNSHAQPGDYLWMGDTHAAIFISCNEQGVYVLDSNNTGRACEVTKQVLPYSRYSSVTICHLQSKQGGHTHNYVTRYEADHPHKEYMECESCTDRYYTGKNTTVVGCAQCELMPDQWGICGDNLIWKLEGTGNDAVLTISGTGDMWDFSITGACNAQATPGAKKRPWKSSYRRVIISEGVTSIGNGAFLGNYRIYNLKLPSTLTRIGDEAFYPADSAFDGIIGTLALPSGLRSIGNDAFRGCNELTGDLIIPDTVTTIGAGAFSITGFNGKLVLPKGLTTIENYTFEWCNFTGNLSLPDSVEHIGNGAFQYCTGFTGGLELPAALKTIGDSAFMRCYGLNGTLTFPDSLTSIGEDAFYENEGLVGALILPKGLNSIGRAAFNKCSGFTGDLILPDNITYIGEWTFCGCTGFTGMLKLPKELQVIDDHAFAYSSGFSSLAPLPDKLTSIGDSAFCLCSGFSGNLVLPSSLVSIGPNAFDGCTGFTGTLTLPDSLRSIGRWAFESDCDFTTLIIPNSELELNGYFPRFSSLKYITIPGEMCPDDVTFGGEIEILTITGSIVKNASLAASIARNTKTVVLSEEIAEIEQGAFASCQKMVRLTLPQTLKKIGDSAFYCCWRLKDVYYTGSKTLWKKVSIGSDNESLTGAVIHYSNSGTSGSIEIRPVDMNHLTGGNKLALSAWTMPDGKKVSVQWSLTEESLAYASITSAGVLTTKAVDSIHNITVIATPTSGSPEARKTIEVLPLVQSVTLQLNGETAPSSKTIDLYDSDTILAFTAEIHPSDAQTEVTWTSSNPETAKVDGSGTVTLLAPGTSVVKATSTDGSKKAGQITLTVIRTDHSPRLGASTLTLNSVSTAGVQVDLVETYGNRIQNVRVDDDRLGAEYEDNVLTLYAREAIAKGTCKVVLTADTDSGTYTYPLTIKVTQALPKLTVKQSNKFDLFYRDSESTLTITGGEVESAAFIGSSDFALENEDDQWFIRYADPENIPAKPGTKVTLSVLFAGYNAPVTKSITIATVNTSPKLKLSPASSVLNTVLTEALEVRAQLAGTDDDNLSVWTDTPGAEVYLDDGTLTIELSAAKAVTVNVYVQSDSWAKPVKLTHKVSVTTKKPTLKAVNSTLKLNSYFPSETASTGLILSQGNLSLSTVELTPTAKAGAAATESEKLSVSYDLDSEEIVAEILDSSIKNGTYSFTCVGTLEDGTAISGGTIKVSVTNTLPKAKLSASTVKLNKRLTGEEATVKVTLTGGNGYTVTGFENLPDFMWYEDGILTVTLPEQSGTYPLYATVSRGDEEAVLPTAVKLTVQVYDKVPSFRLSAKGKLDVLNPDSEIIYTPKLTNALGTATDVELTGASADLFDAEVVNGTIHLTLAKSGDNYSTKATYKIVPLLTICDQQVKGPALSIKVTQSALKLASLPNRTVYTSQATPLLQTLHVTAPAAAEIGDVTLNAKTSAALRSALDTAGGLQSSGATIAFPAKAFTGLKPGNYTVILDIIPVNAASDSKPTQAKFTLTVKK